MILSTVSFSILHALIRYTSQEIHAFEVAFLRVSFGFLSLLPFCLWTRLPLPDARKLRMYLTRAGLSTVAMLSSFLGISLTPLALATALSFSAPLFACALAILFLKEKASWHRWLALLVGFSGAMVILRPGIVALSIGPVVVLLSSMVVAWVLIVIKVLTRTESSLSISTFTALLQIPLTFLACLPFWRWPQPEQWPLFVVMGILGTLGQLCMTQAFKDTDATTVLPLNFFKLIWATLLGMVFLMEIPDVWTWIGGSLIFLGATSLAYGESRPKPVLDPQPR